MSENQNKIINHLFNTGPYTIKNEIISTFNDFISKEKIEELKKQKKKVSLTFKEYKENKVELKKYKLPELKSIAKQHKIPVTGKKDCIIRRIEKRFLEIKNIIKIQKVFRGKIVRLFFNVRGPAIKDRSLCVNDSDGFTLEPLEDIPYERFYSFKDSKDYMYGFDIVSLLQCYKNKGKIINPYTRERIDNRILNEIISLGKITNILFPNMVNPFDSDTRGQPNPTNPATNNIYNGIFSGMITDASVRTNRHFNENFVGYNLFSQEKKALFNKIKETKSRPIHTRINDLFIEIDLLGNYTQKKWFLDLDKMEYIRYFRMITDLWTYRAQLTQETKLRICQFSDPFMNVSLSYNMNIITREQAQEACLTVMENMVYSGVDNEYRKIGALHVLSVLTVVSMPARNSMNWLYESLLY